MIDLFEVAVKAVITMQIKARLSSTHVSLLSGNFCTTGDVGSCAEETGEAGTDELSATDDESPVSIFSEPDRGTGTRAGAG